MIYLYLPWDKQKRRCHQHKLISHCVNHYEYIIEYRTTGHSLWSTGAFPDSGAGVGLGNFWKSWMRVRRGVGCGAKKLLKIFYLYFLYIFTIKIFLKNTLLCLDLQNKERRRQERQNKKEATNIQSKTEEWQI